MQDQVRVFETGATRSSEADKPDYEGYLSPLSLWRYGVYMTKHRRQPDGSIRESDNWQKGIPKSSYMKSLMRHMTDLWLCHRGYPVLVKEKIEDLLCAIIFNAQGMLHELLKETIEETRDEI